MHGMESVKDVLHLYRHLDWFKSNPHFWKHSNTVTWETRCHNSAAKCSTSWKCMFSSVASRHNM